MKKIYSAGNSAEAHLVAEALEQEGIRAHVHEDLPPELPSIWIEDEADGDRAAKVLAEITATASSIPELRLSSCLRYFSGRIMVRKMKR